MKILFCGYKNPHFMAVTDYIEIALNEMGHDVRFFGLRDFLVPGRLRERWPGLERWDRARLNRSLVAAVGGFRPDLLLVNGGHTLVPETIQAIRRSGTMTAMWTSDYPLLVEVLSKLGLHFDRVFVSGSDALMEHRVAGNKNVRMIPFGCLPDLHKPVELDADDMRRFGCDVFFAGTAYLDRVTALTQIAALGGVELGLWGPGWEELPREHPLKRFVRGGPLDTAGYIKAASACKIAFNHIGGFGHIENRHRIRMANSRLFELLGCGACQVVDAKKDVIDMFKDGSELSYFFGPRDMVELIKRYLADADARRELGRRARAAAVARHTYRQRLAELIEACGLTEKK